MAERIPVRFWKGSREQYNMLGAAKKLEANKRYLVHETDGRESEYYGATPIATSTGCLYTVIDIVETLPSTLNVGDRYLVGHDIILDGNGETLSPCQYYVVEIAADMTQSVINPLGSFSVRVINRDMRMYQIVDGNLITYDGIIDCGEY